MNVKQMALLAASPLYNQLLRMFIQAMGFQRVNEKAVNIANLRSLPEVLESIWQAACTSSFMEVGDGWWQGLQQQGVVAPQFWHSDGQRLEQPCQRRGLGSICLTQRQHGDEGGVRFTANRIGGPKCAHPAVVSHCKGQTLKNLSRCLPCHCNASCVQTFTTSRSMALQS